MSGRYGIFAYLRHIFYTAHRFRSLLKPPPEMDMEYNSQRPLLQLPEHGRNVKKMINHAKTIEDKEERQKCVDAIIKVMGQLNPQLRDIEDYNHKLWDHLFILADFDLDVESPYPIPDKETFESKPEKVSYPGLKPKYGHYGKAVENIIQLTIKEEDEEKKKELLNIVGNMMKRFYLSWNRDSVEDETIVKQLNEIADGKLTVSVEDIDFMDTQTILRSKTFLKNPGRSQNSRSKGKKGGGMNSKKKKNNFRKRRY